jgi:hypothetical protein
MRQITIVGAGQAGLLVGLKLLEQGYAVTLVSDRNAEAIGGGSILSTQCLFGSSLAAEGDLNLWDRACPPVEGMVISVAGPEGAPALSFHSRLTRPGLSVDQRVKIPAWMRLFEERGGQLRIESAAVADLERYASVSDLVLVAAGKGEIGALFARDDSRSPYREPQRALAAACVVGYEPARPFDGVCATLIPGAGECFVMPGLTTSGPCHFVFVEAIPGGPLDCWGEVRTADEHVAHLKALLTQWVPWEAERAGTMRAADERATLRGRYAPVVRHPVAMLPSGAPVMGLADTVVLNDPITGQGANNAVRAATHTVERIVAHGAQPFDAAWMQATFDGIWEQAQWATGWTNAMLMPPPPHVLGLLGAASQSPAIAHWFVHGFDDPSTLFPWLADPAAAEQFIAAQTAPRAA